MANESKALAAQLGGFTTFASCDKQDVETLVKAGQAARLPKDWAFVHEGTPADACYVVLDGTAQVYHERQVIAELGPGDVIGEMALFGGGQRRATVTATTAISALRVEYDALKDVFAKRPRVKDALLAVHNAHSGS